MAPHQETKNPCLVNPGRRDERVSAPGLGENMRVIVHSTPSPQLPLPTSPLHHHPIPNLAQWRRYLFCYSAMTRTDQDRHIVVGFLLIQCEECVCVCVGEGRAGVKVGWENIPSGQRLWSCTENLRPSPASAWFDSLPPGLI